MFKGWNGPTLCLWRMCHSLGKSATQKNPAIKDWIVENKKMVGVDFFDRKPSLPSKIRGLPQDVHGLLLFGNHLQEGREIQQRTILRRTVRSGNSGQAEDSAISARERRPETITLESHCSPPDQFEHGYWPVRSLCGLNKKI